MKKALYILVMILFVNTLQAQGVDYKKVVNQWHKARIEDLKKPNGWLNLEGLFWLHKGNNSFGSTNTADCFYDNPSFPSLLGIFNYEGDSVTWTNTGSYLIDIDKVKSNINKTYTVFKASGQASVMDWNQFSWVVIKERTKWVFVLEI